MLAYLNTAWAIQIIRGLFLWLLALCISLLIFAANHAGPSAQRIALTPTRIFPT